MPSDAAQTALKQESGIPGDGGDGKVCALLQSCSNAGGEPPTNRAEVNPSGLMGEEPFDPPPTKTAWSLGEHGVSMKTKEVLYHGTNLMCTGLLLVQMDHRA